MRDVYDYPILATAILEDVDVLITGDKDFAVVDIDHPEILASTDSLLKMPSISLCIRYLSAQNKSAIYCCNYSFDQSHAAHIWS